MSGDQKITMSQLEAFVQDLSYPKFTTYMNDSSKSTLQALRVLIGQKRRELDEDDAIEETIDELNYALTFSHVSKKKVASSRPPARPVTKRNDLLAAVFTKLKKLALPKIVIEVVPLEVIANEGPKSIGQTKESAITFDSWEGLESWVLLHDLTHDES